MKNNEKQGTMVNYRDAKIYQIVNDVNDIVYIGSTTNKYLSNRMAEHRENAKKKTTTVYAAMREVGIEHFRILLIALFPCNSRLELEAEEYAVMKRYKEGGIQLYNMILDRKESKPAFKRGCVSKDGDRAWKFIWRENGKQVSKSFSISTWGEWSAHRMAILWQNMTYPLE